jgi:hypothetical protein
MGNRGLVEKREYKRYLAKKGAYAVLRNHYRSLGEILDISIAGLAFQYVSTGTKLNGCSELDILLDQKGLYSVMLPFKTISDFELDYGVPAGSVRMRRRGVQFTSLRANQLALLENFIKTFTECEI